MRRGLIYQLFIPLVTFPILSVLSANGGPDRSLYFLQIIPGDPDSYIVSQQKRAMEEAYKMAVVAFRHRYPKCSFHTEQIIKTGNESKLFDEIRRIAAHSGKNIAVGFTRSSYARIAAKAAVGSSLIGISIGASSTELRSINPNFISLAAPWTKQWELIYDRLGALFCKKVETFAVFNSKDAYSAYFKRGYEESGFTRMIDLERLKTNPQLAKELYDAKCIFLGMNVSVSQAVLSDLLQHNWKGSVFGTGDWSYFSAELRAFLAESKGRRRFNIFTPRTWKPNENKRSTKWFASLKKRGVALMDPVSVYTHDGVLLGLNHLCLGTDVLKFSRQEYAQMDLLRSYESISESGNLIAPLELIEF